MKLFLNNALRMHRYIGIALFFCLVAIGNVAYGQSPENTALSVFQSKVTVSNSGVIVPTVVEVPFAQITLNRVGFLVREIGTGKLIPSYFKQSIIESKEPLFARSTFGSGTQLVVDNNPISMFSFPLKEKEKKEKKE